TQRESSRKSSRKADDETIVFSAIPWTKRLNRSGSERRQELPARSTRSKRNVGFTNPQHVLDVAMVVVGFDYDVLDLLLNADAAAFRKRRLERSIDIGWKQLRRNGCVSQRTKWPPEEKARRFSNCCRSLKQILI